MTVRKDISGIYKITSPSGKVYIHHSISKNKPLRSGMHFQLAKI